MNIPTSSRGTTAPTPVNSLIDNSIGSTPSAKPTVSDVNEEEEEGNPASLLANNPDLFAALKQQYGLQTASGPGGSSPFLDSLPASVRKRVEGLKGVQQEHAKIESEFQLDILALEKKYSARYAPLYARRSEIVSGKAEPTDAEVAAGEAADSDDEAGASITEVADESDKTTGIPDFWLTALKNHIGIAELITEADEDALRSLNDIELSYLDAKQPGFKLTFSFGPNDFFTNEKLEKTYYYQEEVGYGGDLVYEKAVGTEIAWKEDKDLTTKVEIKKQRNKTTNRTRVVKKVIPADSFFNFFKPPTTPTEEMLQSADDSEVRELLDELDQRAELDYQIGEDIKERIIPRAVDYFSGKALQYDGMDDFDEDDEFTDDYDEDDDDEDMSMRQAHPAPGTSAQDPQECKQQ